MHSVHQTIQNLKNLRHGRVLVEKSLYSRPESIDLYVRVLDKKCHRDMTNNNPVDSGDAKQKAISSHKTEHHNVSSLYIKINHSGKTHINTLRLHPTVNGSMKSGNTAKWGKWLLIMNKRLPQCTACHTVHQIIRFWVILWSIHIRLLCVWLHRLLCVQLSE